MGTKGSLTKFHSLLQEQVRNEFTSSQQYIALAVWFDGQDLPQLAKHFYRQSLEERNHAMMIVRELLVPPCSLLPPSVLGGGDCVGGDDDSEELEDVTVEG